MGQPVPSSEALHPEEVEAALREAERLASAKGIHGKELTPFLLARLAEATGGRSLNVNQTLILANVRLAARVAAAVV